MPLGFTSLFLPLACDCGPGWRASSAASAYDLGGRSRSARSSGAEGSGFSDMASNGRELSELVGDVDREECQDMFGVLLGCIARVGAS